LSFDIFHKRFAVELSSPASASLQAALPSGPAAPVVTARATQIIEDKDAAPGYFTLDTVPASGFAIFAYTTESGSAQLSVERFDGTDLDVTVEYSTEVMLPSEIGSVPFAYEVVDGSHGSNSFCLANNSRSTGVCVDSSSALKCVDGFCYILQYTPAKPAIEQTGQFVIPSADALFIRTRGQLRWKQG